MSVGIAVDSGVAFHQHEMRVKAQIRGGLDLLAGVLLCPTL
jgi:hypothetical protein